MKTSKTDRQPHPDDFMVVNIGLEFRAKENPANTDPHPLDGPADVMICLPADGETAELLEDIAKAIRERRLYGFMAQESAESPVGSGEWIERDWHETAPEEKPALPAGVKRIGQ